MNIISKDINVSQNVGIGATVTLFIFQVPSRSTMKLTHFGNYIDTIAAWGSITWRIRRNGVGVFPYQAILDQIGTNIEPRLIAPVIFMGGDTLIINVTNATAGIVACGIALKYELLGD